MINYRLYFRMLVVMMHQTRNLQIQKEDMHIQQERQRPIASLMPPLPPTFTDGSAAISNRVCTESSILIIDNSPVIIKTWQQQTWQTSYRSYLGTTHRRSSSFSDESFPSGERSALQSALLMAFELRRTMGGGKQPIKKIKLGCSPALVDHFEWKRGLQNWKQRDSCEALPQPETFLQMRNCEANQDVKSRYL